MVPTLPDAFGDSLDDRIFESIPHGPAQALILAVCNLAPHIERSSFTNATTVADVVYWLQPLVAEGEAVESGNAKFPPRGSYRTQSVTLRPLLEADVHRAFVTSLDPRLAHRWRFRGLTPSPEEFRRALYAPNIFAQFVVLHRGGAGQDGIGIVSAYDADFNGGTCKAAFQRFAGQSEFGEGPRQEERGLMVEGMLVFFQYLFDHFTFRKIYLEVPEYNLDLVGDGMEVIFKNEGELREHYYYGERYWSQYLLALYRADWDSVAEPFRGAWARGRDFDSDG